MQATVLLTEMQTGSLSVGLPVYHNLHQYSPGISLSGYRFGKEENGFNYFLSKTLSYAPVLSNNRWFCFLKELLLLTVFTLTLDFGKRTCF